MKRIITFILALTLCVSLFACESKEKNKNRSDKESNSSIPLHSAQKIELNNNIRIDEVCEFTIENIQITDKVSPADPDSWYTSYKSGEGKKYVDILIVYKNTSTEDQNIENNFEISLYYGENYVYNGLIAIEESDRSDFTYDDTVIPLASEYVHALIKIPDTVASGEGSLVAVFEIHGNKYQVNVRSGIDKYTESKSSGAIDKKGGKIALNELLYIPNKCEFLVEHCDMTYDIVPKNPSMFYTHYEADEGKIYVDLLINYKHLGSTEEEFTNFQTSKDSIISATLIYNGKYRYSGFYCLEDEDRSDFSSSGELIPLSSEYIHCLFEVPEEVKNSQESLSIELKIGGNNYTFTIR